MSRKSSYYYVYDKDDHLVMCGELQEVCKWINITKSNVTRAVRKKHLVAKNYRIYREDEIDKSA